MQHCMQPKCQDVQCKASVIDDCNSGYLINNYSTSTRIGYEMVNSQQLRLHCNVIWSGVSPTQSLTHFNVSMVSASHGVGVRVVTSDLTSHSYTLYSELTSYQ